MLVGGKLRASVLIDPGSVTYSSDSATVNVMCYQGEEVFVQLSFRGPTQLFGTAVWSYFTGALLQQKV